MTFRLLTPQPIATHLLTQTMTARAPTLRSLYRRLLRELPSRQPSLLANPSPLQHRIRSRFLPTAASLSPTENRDPHLHNILATDQMIQYVKAQRLYTTLLERYNPGMNMNEEERTRLTARRVGMDLPEEFKVGSGGR